MSWSRRLLEASVVAVIVTGLSSSLAPAPAAAAIPPIRIKVPHIERPPTVGRPLDQSEWLRGNSLYRQRLRDAGSEEALAVEDTVRRIREARLREAIRKCAEEGARSAFNGSAQALVAAGEEPNLHDAVACTISGCLSSQLPEETPDEAIDEVSTYLADQLMPPVKDAVQTSSSVDVSLTLPTVSGDDATPVEPGPVPPPTPPDGGSFPWGAVVAIGGVAGVALVIRAARKRS
jgi:hypothetical protein